MRQLVILLFAIVFSLPLSATPATSGAYLGVNSYRLSKAKAAALAFDNPYGSYLTRVYENTPAAETGLQPFDYIYAIGDHVADSGTDLSDMLHDFNPGDKTIIYLIRKGKKMTLEVTLGQRQYTSRPSMTADRDPHFGIWEDELENGDDMGVVVTVSKYGLAKEMGLRSHDRILSFAGYPMVDFRDLSTAINNMKIGDDFEVVYERDGEKMSATGTMRSKAEHEKIAARIKAEGSPFMGINFEMIDSEKAKALGYPNNSGTYVTGIIPGSGAERAKLLPLDYLYGINGEEVDDNTRLSDLVSNYRPGDSVELMIMRKGEKMTLPMTFGTRDQAGKAKDRGCDDPTFGVYYDDAGRNQAGVGVTISRGSSAERLGLQDHDIILEINGYTMVDYNDVTTAINMLNAGEIIEVVYERDGKQLTGSTKVGSSCDKNSDTPVNTWHPDAPQPDPATAARYRDLEQNYEQINMDNAKVSISNISSTEAEDMQQLFGVTFPLDNTLEVNQLRLFPNAVEGFFRLEFNLPQEDDTVVRLYNSAGRQIYNYELVDFGGPFADDVDISQNGTGAYFLEIVQGDKTLVKKVEVKNPAG